MKIRNIISFLLVLILVVACDKSQLEQPNPNQFTVESYYADGDQLTAATNGIYSEFYGAAYGAG